LKNLSDQHLLAVMIGDKKLSHYYLPDIVALIELGIIHPQDPVFHYSFKKWCAAASLKEVRQLLSEETLMRFQQSSPHPAPSFTPPPPPMSAYFSLSYGRENHLTQVEDLKEHKANLEKAFESKRNQVKNLEHDLEKSEGVVSELKSDVKNWQEQYYQMKVDYEDLKGTLARENSKIKEDLERLNDKYQDLKMAHNKSKLQEAWRENKKLAQAVKKLGKSKKQLMVYVEDLKKQLNDALVSREHLKKEVKKKDVDLVKLKKRENKAKKLIRELGSERNTMEAQRKVDLKRLIGESFEVSNEPIWLIKRAGEVKGPYRFSDVLSWFDKGFLDGKTLLRKESEKVFTRLEKIYEFNTKIFTKLEKASEETNGELKKRYFIKRTDFRAPFHETARLEFRGRDLRGTCTSLSVGGCFIEFSDEPEGLERNSVLVCHIEADYLSTPIDVQMIVRNVSKERSFGIGCEFLDLSDEEKDTIEEFIDSYLHSKAKAAA
jgi:hypothetical protein